MIAPNTPTLTLGTLRTAALPRPLQADSPPPTRLVVLPWGVNKSRRGDFVVDDLTAKVFAENQKRHRFDGRVALDFEHNTLPGTPAYESSSEPRPVAAWALCVVNKGEGVVYEDLQWTPDGLSAWQRGLYQDISPSPVRGKDGRTVIALHSAALCRHGELEDLSIAHAAAPRALTAYFEALSADAAADPTPAPLSPTTKPKPLMKEKLIALLAKCGVTLAPDADEAATTAALDQALTKMAAPAEVDPMACASKAAKPEGMSAEILAVRAEMDQMRKENVIQRATAEGKVIPLSADVIKITPLAALEELVKAAKPGEVKTHANGTTGKEPGNPGAAKPEPLSAETLEVYRQCGLTEAEIATKKEAAEKAAQTA